MTIVHCFIDDSSQKRRRIESFIIWREIYLIIFDKRVQIKLYSVIIIVIIVAVCLRFSSQCCSFFASLSSKLALFCRYMVFFSARRLIQLR